MIERIDRYGRDASVADLVSDQTCKTGSDLFAFGGIQGHAFRRVTTLVTLSKPLKSAVANPFFDAWTCWAMTFRLLDTD